MRLPNELEEFIEEKIYSFSLNSLKLAAEKLSFLYRQGEGQLNFPGFHLAYLNVRLPATFASVFYVLEELKKRIPNLTIESMEDIGSGPGTGMWACHEVFPHVKHYTLYEKDREFIRLGKEISEKSSFPALQQSKWIHTDASHLKKFSADLVLFSYSYGEFKSINYDFSEVSYLVFIEPGTPKGFENLNLIRKELCDKSWYIVAPCPNISSCPMQKDQWCHFSQRLERTKAHRFLKSGSLGFEDEKFSYLIFSKQPHELKGGRLIHQIQKNSKEINLTMCHKEGLKKFNILKRNKENFNYAKKLKWGNVFDERKF